MPGPAEPGTQVAQAPGLPALPKSIDPAQADIEAEDAEGASGRELAAPDAAPLLSIPQDFEDTVEEAALKLPKSDRKGSPTLIFDAGPDGESSAQIVAGGVADGGDATASKPVAPAGKAGLVSRGTLVPAVLETAIDTSKPGYVRAIVGSDVRSASRKSVLIPRSSRLVGQYKSGTSGGRTRAYVVWKRLVRPDGKSVNISSLVAGSEGAALLPDGAERQFFGQLGSAGLVSVVATGSADEIRVRQGEPVRILTSRDLNFAR